MEKLPLNEKENMSGLNSFQLNYALSQATNPQFLPPNIPRKAKSKVKSQKGFSSNLRAGDWICLICNNLNFSFRNECNRCQLQTKEQNQLQSLYIQENQNILNDSDERLPFKDLTNNRSSQSKAGPLSFHTKSKSTPMQSDLTINMLPKMSTEVEITEPSTNNTSGLTTASSSNKGFQNMLLVTPPKHRQNKSLNIFKEYSDSGQKELPPYKSPEYLPSISPMLNAVFGNIPERQGGRRYQSFTFLKEECEEAEQEEAKTEDLNQDLPGVRPKFENASQSMKEVTNLFANTSLENERQQADPSLGIDHLAEESKFFHYANKLNDAGVVRESKGKKGREVTNVEK